MKENWYALLISILKKKSSGDSLREMGVQDPIFIRNSYKPKKSAKSFPEWVYIKAKENGVGLRVLNNRINIYHWDYETACTEPIMKGGGRIASKKKSCSSLQA